MNTMEIKINENIDLENTLNCGQSFRWEKRVDGSFSGIVEDFFIKVVQEQGLLKVESTKLLTQNYIEEYFDLNRDYTAVFLDLKDKDKLIGEAYKEYIGLKVLNQNPWEILISFIISANNNIKRITKIIENISKEFGNEISIEGEVVGYSFPTAEKLAEASIESLMACNLGYRAEYIKSTSQSIIDGVVNLDEIRTMNYELGKKELMKLKGVGGKVADCILLFSMNKSEAFPIDTWVKKIMKHFYIKNEIVKDSEMKAFIVDYFGKDAGILQQYLFHYIRNRDYLLKN